MSYEDEKYIKLAEERVQWWDFLMTVMDLKLIRPDSTTSP
jgi:hypothetical protein